nr:hypothetical protein [Calditrichia bacterium]
DLRYTVLDAGPLSLYAMAHWRSGAIWERPDDRVRRSDFENTVALTFAADTFLGPLHTTLARLAGRRTAFFFSFGFDF